jgi:two-component system, OmpR family, torCAD operon response regulator TorR
MSCITEQIHSKDFQMNGLDLHHGSILVVDDSDVTRETLVSYFEEEGYTVFSSETAEDAELILLDNAIDLILLDIRLPGKDGLTLTRELRVKSEIGIILVTGRHDEIDRIIGLECGADEYVTKPFNPREILARSKNLVRRVKKLRALEEQEESTINSSLLPVGNCWLDQHRRSLTKESGEVIQLTEGEFQLLIVLVEHAGKPLSRDQLMERLRNRSWNATDRTIDVLIGRIRKKLEDDTCQPKWLITVHGVGYLFSPH